MRSVVRSLAVAASLAISASPAFGQIVVGNNNASNCFPFNCGSITRYQQIYDASAFGSNPFLITTIGFFSAGPTSYNTSTVSLTIGTTNVGPLAILPVGTNPISNAQTFFTNVTLTGTITDPTFGGTPYLYDPSQGNLILDWTFSPYGSYQYTNGYMQADGTPFNTTSCSGVTGRAWNSVVEGSANDGCGALVTAFNGRRPNINVVPEPASVLLVGAGLATLLGVARRRRA
ncbi:MAG: PEP-CTERM sorting domain-containing protein [Gemmatimonadetes bacterium]|nr:PEP-CTERM sorting domain-containing protein [Gemmatimonadota bacterium]